MAQHLFIHAPTVVMAARVNMATVEFPLTEITFDTVTTGAYTAVKRGMTLLVGSSAGADDLGRQRIRLDAAANTLYIGRSSQGVLDGEVNVSDEMYLTVLNDRRAWAKIPYIDPNGLIVKDEISYTDETSNIPPKANIAGGARASTINSGTSLSTFQFVGSASYAVASGATISTYSWDVGDGTITAGTGTNTITATFPAGFRYVSLTVTDSNGKTHTQYVPVLAHNPAVSLCVAFQCAEHTIGQQGQTAAFRILQDLAATTHPDGALVIFWEGEPASTSDFTNVRFWGWHQTNTPVTTASPEATIRDDVIYCLDVANRFKTLPGFPITVERKDSPTAWSEMAGLTMDLYVDYILRWHSNLLDLTYYTPTGTGATYPMGIISSDGQNIFDQAAQRTNSLIPDYILTCDRNGQVKSIVDPMLQDTADRTATSQATIGTNKWIGVNWLRQRPPRFHWRRGEALRIWTTNEPNPLFCVSPGTAPGQGESPTGAGEKLVVSQDILNSWNGHAYARINARHGLVPIQIANDDDRIQPANMTWATVNVPDTYTRRQLGFSSARGLPIEVNVTYEYGEGVVKRAEMLWERETSGTAAVTVIPPTPGHDPPWTPPPNPFPTPTPTPGTGFGTAYVLTGSHLARTRSLSAVSPDWKNITGSLTGTLYDFILDPYRPASAGYVIGSDGVWRLTTLDTAVVTYSQLLTSAQIDTLIGSTRQHEQKLVASINQDGHIAFVTRASGSMHYVYSTDYGANWSQTTYKTGLHNQAVNQFRGGFDIVPHLVSGALRIYATAQEITTTDFLMFRSDNSGATFSEVGTISTGVGTNHMALHCPFNDNAGGSVLYLADPSQNRVWRSIDSGANFTAIVTTQGTNVRRQGVETYTQNRQIMYYWGEDNILYISGNAGTSFTAAAMTGLSGNIKGSGGFPYVDSQFYALTTTGIFVSTNSGANWIDKTGNWAFGFSTFSDGGGVIVPNWLE